MQLSVLTWIKTPNGLRIKNCGDNCCLNSESENMEDTVPIFSLKKQVGKTLNVSVRRAARGCEIPFHNFTAAEMLSGG